MDLETLKTVLGFGGIGLAGLSIYLGYKERAEINVTLRNHFAHMEQGNKEVAKANTRLAVSLDRNTLAIDTVIKKVVVKSISETP